MTDLRRRISKWNTEESDDSEDHRPSRPMRTASLPNKRRRAPPPPPPGSRTTSGQPHSLGPMLQSTKGTLRARSFDADRIEFITSMSQVTIGDHSSSSSTVPEELETELKQELNARTPVPKSAGDISAELNEVELPGDIGNSLVRCVKTSSSLGSLESRQVLRAVLSHLGSQIPPLDRLMDKIMTEFLAEVKFARDADAEATLQDLFAKLEARRDDLQQITHPIGDDLGEICLLLQNLLATIGETHREAVLAVLEENHFEKLIVLASYFQLESRREIRLGVLKILNYLLGLSCVIARHLIPTVFTVECAQEIVANVKTGDDYALILTETFTTMLATEETLTVFALEHLSQSWILNILECTLGNNMDGRVIDSVVNLALALNLHYADHRVNVVIGAIGSAIQQWSNISERLMLHFNRGSDPLIRSQFDVTSTRNSVLKFLVDIHSTSETSEFLYTSDRNILIEIVLRSLLDLEADAPEREEYLGLLRMIVTHSGWRETRHKSEQLTSVLELLARDKAEFQHNSLHDRNRRLAQEILRVMEKCK